MGTAHPMNLIIDGTDILETEMVGTALARLCSSDISATDIRQLDINPGSR